MTRCPRPLPFSLSPRQPLSPAFPSRFSPAATTSSSSRVSGLPPFSRSLFPAAAPPPRSPPDAAALLLFLRQRLLRQLHHSRRPFSSPLLRAAPPPPASSSPPPPATPHLRQPLPSAPSASSTPSPSPRPFSKPFRRAFSLYDQINLINKVPDDQLRIQGYHDTGFTVNGVEYEGSLLIADNSIMSWSPRSFSEITADSLSIFKLLRPTPEILILGCGRHIQNLDPNLRKFLKSTGMKLESVDSRNAASTFNILNEEGRMVATALLPYGVLS